MKKSWILYGSELSPFTLKVKAILDFQKIPYRFFWTQGNTWENLKIQLRKEALIRGYVPLTWPIMDENDEFPLVPFLFGPQGENLYDSSAIAEWLESQQLGANQISLFCKEHPELNFVICLIDEYADEYGLYLVHHNRWKIAAATNNAGKRLGYELRSLLGPLRPVVAHYFSARQVRRLPYLFSVAPQGFHIACLPKRLQPPRHLDFPPTHQLLEASFANLLQACESLLKVQPYLLGARFTLADASLYGQLGMNLKDPDAATWIKQQAPMTYAWLQRITNASFKESKQQGTLYLHEGHRLLLKEICRTYVPLMQQNLKAYEHYKKNGETVFNEKAFQKKRALYDGHIDGIPFKHVVKTFQVNTWRSIRKRWKALPLNSRNKLEGLLPCKHGLNNDL